MPQTSTTSLTIAQRLAFGFALVLSLMLLIALVGIQRVGVIDDTLKSVSEGASLKQRYAINFRGSVHDRAIAIRDLVLAKNPEQVNQLLIEIDQLKAFYLSSAGPLNTLLEKAPADEQALLKAIQYSEQQALSSTTALIKHLQSNDPTSADTRLQTQTAESYRQWLAQINRFIDHQEQQINLSIETIRSTADSFSLLILLVTGLALLLSVVVNILIVRNLRATLGAEPFEVADVITRLAAGDLSQPIQTRQPKSVMGAVAQMAASLSDTIIQVRSAASALNRASSQLLETSSNNSQQLQLQSQAAEQVSHAISQMTDSVIAVANHAQHAATATSNADSGAQAGNQVVVQTATAIQQLSNVLDDAVSQVEQLSTDSANIERIIAVITSIADQTNLLALNAAIEAARAGAHGRGFAVVADEVRALANRTQDATREISSMISQLQTGAEETADVMKTSSNLAQNTVHSTASAEQALVRIRQEVGDIKGMNQQIAEAAEQQSQVAEQVRQEISRILAATLEASAGSSQVASASHELSTLAQNLQEKVSLFHT